MSTDAVATDQPITSGGIASVNFFNGRLLTGEDLTREQDGSTLARLRIGRAVGCGIACGFEVQASASSTGTRPVVHVAPGLALNGAGRALELGTGVELGLTRERRDGGAPAELDFHDCVPVQPGTSSAGAGSYLLTVAPAKENVGRAAVSGLGNTDAACNVAYSVEGVQFQLLRLALPAALLAEPERLRNHLAHLAIGTADPRRYAAENNPLGTPVGAYGLLDDLRAAECLGPEQVPLAVLTWTAAAGIGFVDLWAVRRRVTRPAASALFPTMTEDRAATEAEAVFLQFQEQVAESMANGEALSTVTAASRFAYLPPVGIIPITYRDGSGRGFDPDAFLGAQGSADLAMLDASLLPALVREGALHRPIEVGGPERVQRYLIWENDRDVTAGSVARRALVFAGASLPYRGVARYGFANYDRSRVAPSVI